jgi:hypothetical protein
MHYDLFLYVWFVLIVNLQYLPDGLNTILLIILNPQSSNRHQLILSRFPCYLPFFFLSFPLPHACRAIVPVFLGTAAGPTSNFASLSSALCPLSSALCHLFPDT